ncbi:MAG TPA: hypothetical protein VE733_26785 [Streptosporangiaceae bacterium]|nr:hypothetical protein [Streptosporangiaceae bacterium]
MVTQIDPGWDGQGRAKRAQHRAYGGVPQGQQPDQGIGPLLPRGDDVPGGQPLSQLRGKPTRADVGHHHRVGAEHRHAQDPGGFMRERHVRRPAVQQPLPQGGHALRVGAEQLAFGDVVGGGHLRGDGIDDFPHPGRHIQQAVGIDPVAAVRLLDQRLPHQPAAQPERAQHIIQRHSLLGPAAAGRPRRVEVPIAFSHATRRRALGDQLQHPGEVVMTRLPQVIVRNDSQCTVARILLLNRPHQSICEGWHSLQHPHGKRLRHPRRSAVCLLHRGLRQTATA